VPTHLPAAQQTRSRQTQEQIQNAAYELIEENGLEALTVAAVADRAGVAVGSVYRRFGDKDRLLLAVQRAFADRIRDGYRRRLDTSLLPSGLRAPQMVAHAVRGLADTFHANERLLRVFLILGAQNPVVHQAGSRQSIEGLRYFEDFLSGIEIAHADRDAAIDFAYRMLYAALAHRVTHGPELESDRPLPWEELKQRLTHTISNYLLNPPPS
jgi:AcrR family transcriptional regulator